jgi:hypothetical protein
VSVRRGLGLPAKIVELHRSLDRARVAHAFGGALALAWCTGRPRGTVDIDLNVFLATDQAGEVLAALPSAVSVDHDDLERLERDGQVRLWWDRTPIDLFLNTTDFHELASTRARRYEFNGVELPFLACVDLAVFKAFFDRTKDWADLEEMNAAGTLEVDQVLAVLIGYLGVDDHRVARLAGLA